MLTKAASETLEEHGAKRRRILRDGTFAERKRERTALCAERWLRRSRGSIRKAEARRLARAELGGCFNGTDWLAHRTPVIEEWRRLATYSEKRREGAIAGWRRWAVDKFCHYGPMFRWPGEPRWAGDTR